MSPITRLTVQDYDRMIDAGAFAEPDNSRVELIEGEVQSMSPIGARHEEIVDLLNEWGATQFPLDRVRVRIQQSVGIPLHDSAPQPDFVIVVKANYSRGRPLSERVLLLVEVADSSLRYDRKVKGALYAKAGIADYWIVNLVGQCVEVFRQPQDGKYANRALCQAGATIHPLAFPDVTLDVGQLFAALED